MKKIQQQIIRLTNPGFTAEDVIAGLKKIPGYIFAYAYASTEASGNEADAVVLLTAVTGEPRFHDNQRVAYVEDAPKPEIVIADGDDWVGAFVNGELVIQDHTLSVRDLVNVLKGTGITVKRMTVNSEWLASEGHFPDKLADVEGEYEH